MSFLKFVFCEDAFACPAARTHHDGKMPLSLHCLNLRQIVGMNHYRLNQTFGMNECQSEYIQGTGASRAQTPADFPCRFATRLPNIACGEKLRFKIGP
jgi:hypothetical protein